jgi:hypothetical protein
MVRYSVGLRRRLKPLHSLAFAIHLPKVVLRFCKSLIGSLD